MPEQVFISYAHDDREWASLLARELATRGFVPYFDKNSLRAGQNWEGQLLDALEESRHMAVLWSANAKESAWVQRERAHFDRKRHAGQRRLPGHVMVHVQLDDTQSAFESDQSIGDILEASAYGKGAAQLPAATWTRVGDQLARAFGDRSLPVTTAVITLTHDELGRVDFDFRPPAGRTLNELLSDIRMTRDDLLAVYGPTRQAWRPFGGAETIEEILEQVRMALNKPGCVTTVRWMSVEDDFFSGHRDAIDRAAAKLASDPAVVIIDPIALYAREVGLRLEWLARCHENPHAAIVVLPIFASPPQPRMHHELVRQVYRRLVEQFYEDPPLRAGADYAHCSVLGSDHADIQRMVRSVLRRYWREQPVESATTYLGMGRVSPR